MASRKRNTSRSVFPPASSVSSPQSERDGEWPSAPGDAGGRGRTDGAAPTPDPNPTLAKAASFKAPQTRHDGEFCPTSQVILRTKRLQLRTWADGDAEEFNRVCNTEGVMRWLGGVQADDELLEDVEYFTECQDEEGITFWVLERDLDDAFLGFCGLVRVLDEDSTVRGELEIGWRLREDAWGQGYASEAAKATLQYAFCTLQAERVVSRTAEGNERSQLLMQRLGMSRCPALDYEPDDGSDRLLVFDVAAPPSLAAKNND